MPEFFNADQRDRCQLHLMEVFDAFVAKRAGLAMTSRTDRPWRDSSIAMYRSAWGAFSNYCAERHIELAELTVADLESYLARRAERGANRGRHTHTEELNDRYAYRVLSLIDRLAAFDAARHGTVKNTAARALIDRDYTSVNHRDKDSLPRFLDKAERTRLISVLTLPLGTSEPGAPRTWLELRDNAAVAVQLGAGIAPVEVRRLRLEDVVPSDDGRPCSLDVCGRGDSARRRVSLASWAGRVLAGWLAERARQGLAAPWVFCTDEAGQWAKNTCDKATDDVLKRSGVSTQAGQFRLRHTFALIEIRDNKRSFGEVAHTLGVKDKFAVRLRYERVLDEFKRAG